MIAGNGGEGFIDFLVRLMSEQEAIRGIVAGGLIVLLSIPKVALGEVLKQIPEKILPRQGIPSVLALVGFILGAALGHFTPLPVDLSIAVGTGAGWSSGATHDMKRKGTR